MTPHALGERFPQNSPNPPDSPVTTQAINHDSRCGKNPDSPNQISVPQWSSSLPDEATSMPFLAQLMPIRAQTVPFVAAFFSSFFDQQNHKSPAFISAFASKNPK
nr:hypothetical protein [Pseudomonas sp. s4]